MEERKNASSESEFTITDIPCPDIPGVDTARGIAMTGGTATRYCQVLSIFRRDADDRLRMLRFFLLGDGGTICTTFPEKHLSSFITQIQALKSASATLGAIELSELAFKLETAGKNRDLVFVQSNLLDFVAKLAELTQNIRIALEQIKKKEDTALLAPDPSAVINNCLMELSAALRTKKTVPIEHFLNELNEKHLDPKTMELLEQVSDQVLMMEFDSAIKTIDEFLEANK